MYNTSPPHTKRGHGAAAATPSKFAGDDGEEARMEVQWGSQRRCDFVTVWDGARGCVKGQRVMSENFESDFLT
jgi:hypothetical protein